MFLFMPVDKLKSYHFSQKLKVTLLSAQKSSHWGKGFAEETYDSRGSG